MDPFSSEGELLNISTAFHLGQHSSVLSASTASLSPENVLPARVYQLRSRIATGEAAAVSSELADASEPELLAVRAFAEYKSGNEDAVALIEELAGAHSDNAIVQVLGGTVLHLAGRSEDALTLLGKHQGSLEAVALIVQIRLSQNRTDLALKEVNAAKKWANDSLLVNLAEAWVGLRVGGEKYQGAFYVYEELAQAPGSSGSRALVGQAVAELHLGRLEEAVTSLETALGREEGDQDALANMVVLQTIANKPYQEHLAALKEKAPEHPFLVDLEQKNELFDRAAQKYSPKVAAA